MYKEMQLRWETLQRFPQRLRDKHHRFFRSDFHCAFERQRVAVKENDVIRVRYHTLMSAGKKKGRFAYQTSSRVNAAGGIRTSPFSSTGGKISKVARILAMEMNTTLNAKCLPGQTLSNSG